MPWQPLERFDDPAVPKLANLRRARRAGLEVPATAWAPAPTLEAEAPSAPPAAIPAGPWIVRSGSPTEDTAETSNAGQLLSLPVDDPSGFADAVARVVAALPREGGRPLGAVFVQPLLEAEVAGVTFFDGFYFEETRAAGTNQELTSGRERGEVRRGHLRRGDRHHDWLARIQRVFGGRLDIEWALPPGREAGGAVLLQVRPALFPIRRCETISLANHKEILGDPPSPWMVGVIAEAGRPALRFFERVDPAIAAWEESYAIELGERAWMNFSVFFRIMDRWGMPRATVTEGVGGESDGPLDRRLRPGRFVLALPTFLRLLAASLATLAATRRGLLAIDADLDRAAGLADLQRANVRALVFSIRTNFAIMTLLSGVARIRKAIGIDQAGQVVTRAMMAEYARVAALPGRDDRLLGLDAWLARYGHRGPLESDPRRPRFAELRDALRADLEPAPAPLPRAPDPPPAWLSAIGRPLFLLDEFRERFRDRLMHRWQRLRLRILEEAAAAVARGWIDDPDDAFFLRSEDLGADPATWRGRAARRRSLVAAAAALDLPTTAPRDVVEAAIAAADHLEAAADPGRFPGIGLGRGRVVGTAVRAREVTALLGAGALPKVPILVVETLEPSWAVVFPRFAAVVTDLGGELSHASILLREAGIPAVINARGAYRAIADGDLIRVDPAAGEVRIETRRGPAGHEKGGP